jgi:hypothetical protein
MHYGFLDREEAILIENAKLPKEIRVAWPPDSVVLYALDDKNEIVARMGVVEPPHIEGTWIREDNRNAFMAKRMISQMEKFLLSNEKQGAFAFVENSNTEVQDYMKRLGYSELPLKVYFKFLVEEEKRKVV